LDDSDLESLVVKLDVEGAEPRTLADMSTSIRRAAVFAELNREALQAGGSSIDRLIDDLFAAGLSCAWIDEDEGAVVPLHEGRPFTKGNLVCVKRANG
jgi:hypothetical protein